MLFGPVLNTAMKAMMASQYALSVASNNIANANNPDFTRQRLITRPSHVDTAWGIGTGVDVVGVEAFRDHLVETRYRNALSARSGAEMQAGRLSDIEGLFNDANGTGLSKQITNFFNSFHDLAQDPASMPYREQVRTRGIALADAFKSKDRELSKARTDADRSVNWDVQEINRLSREIAGLTAQIKSEEPTNGALELRDRRVALVKELSEYVQVDEVDGSEYQLSTQGGHLLVVNNVSQDLTAQGLTSSVGAGKLAADLETRDNFIPKYQAALDELAYRITTRVNELHSAGYNLDGTQNNFFAAPAAVSGAANNFALSAEVLGDPRRIAAGNLTSGTDNGAATAIAAVLSETDASGRSVMDQYGSFVSTIGSDVSVADAKVVEQSALETQLENRRQSISGVSIDEETLQISQFQRSYQASAQLLQVVDELLQVTLGMVGR